MPGKDLSGFGTARRVPATVIFHVSVLSLMPSLALAPPALPTGEPEYGLLRHSTGSLATARWANTAKLLPNGQVLVAGGLNGFGGVDSAELYDPATGAWTPTGSLPLRAGGHTGPPLQIITCLTATWYYPPAPNPLLPGEGE